MSRVEDRNNEDLSMRVDQIYADVFNLRAYALSTARNSDGHPKGSDLFMVYILRHSADAIFDGDCSK